MVTITLVGMPARVAESARPAFPNLLNKAKDMTTNIRQVMQVVAVVGFFGACQNADPADDADAGLMAGGGRGGQGTGGERVAGGSVFDSEAARNFSAFSAELGRLICESMVDCCVAAGDSIDADACRANFQAKFADDEVRLAAAWDADLAGQCLEQVAALGECVFGAGVEAFQGSTAACEAVFDLGRGNAPEGASCATDDDCAPSTSDDVAVYCSEVCVHESFAEPRGALGDACGSTCLEHRDGASECRGTESGGAAACFTNDGLRCGSMGTCERLAAVGDACTASLDCAEGLRCGPDATCSARVQEGGPCADDFGSPDPLACVDGYCDAGTLTCVPPVAEGAPCDDSNMCAAPLLCDFERLVCAPPADPLVEVCHFIDANEH